MDAASEVGNLNSVLLLLVAALVGLVSWQIRNLAVAVKAKVDECLCAERRQTCVAGCSVKELEKGQEELWEAFGKHGHTGLAPEARVTR